VDVGGLTFEEAYKKGFVEPPTHLPQFGYRYGSSSTGVSDYRVVKKVHGYRRQVAVSYALMKKHLKTKVKRIKFKSCRQRFAVPVINTLPHNFNPASNNSNTAYSGRNFFPDKKYSSLS
jgi:iron complex outermembrane receptor protein